MSCSKIIFFFLLVIPNVALSQVQGSGVAIDTIRIKSEECFVRHYHERSDDRRVQMFSMSSDDIFDKRINNFSSIYISATGHNPIEVPTIPLDNLIVLDEWKLVIGLTKIMVSPYKIVIYNFDGKILYKGSLGIDIIKLDFNKLQELTQKFPVLLSIFKNNGNVIKRKDSLYFIELSNDVRHVLGKNFVQNYFLNDWQFIGSYLPFKIATTGNSGRQYRRYLGGYLNSSPYNELIGINNVPFILVLNNVNGGKSYIPLVSNCDIEKDLTQ